MNRSISLVCTALLVTLVVVAGCIGGSGTPTTTVAPTTVAPTTVAPTTVAPTTTPPATTVPPTTLPHHSMEYGWPMAHADASNSGFVRTSVPDAPNLLWQYVSQGSITTSPVVEYETSFFFELVGKTTSLVSLDYETGDVRWRYAIPTQGVCQTTPCVYEGMVYFPAVFYVYSSRNAQYYYEYYLLAVDACTGERAWYVPLGGFPQVGSSPVAYDGAVYLGEGYLGDGHVESYDAVSGERLWKTDFDGEPIHTVSVSDTAIYASTDAGALYVLDRTTGDITASWDLFEAGAAGPVTLAGTRLLVNGVSLALREEGYGAGQLVALNMATGETLWIFGVDNSTSVSQCSASGAYAVLATATTTDNNTVACISLTSGAVRWSTGIRGFVMAGMPAIGTRSLVVADSTSRKLYHLSLTDGAILWSFDLGETTPFTPAIADGKVYAAVEEGVLSCLG